MYFVTLTTDVFDVRLCTDSFLFLMPGSYRGSSSCWLVASGTNSAIGKPSPTSPTGSLATRTGNEVPLKSHGWFLKTKDPTVLYRDHLMWMSGLVFIYLCSSIFCAVIYSSTLQKLQRKSILFHGVDVNNQWDDNKVNLI